ncbi:hypothetical protein T492DRAFT_1107819 [Pavlovales sp. CCMP2436]|nr:hypothetical protein T492DRAFT_1107819 [Pavlovales sp. CCMP2436]
MAVSATAMAMSATGAVAVATVAVLKVAASLMIRVMGAVAASTVGSEPMCNGRAGCKPRSDNPGAAPRPSPWTPPPPDIGSAAPGRSLPVKCPGAVGALR